MVMPHQQHVTSLSSDRPDPKSPPGSLPVQPVQILKSAIISLGLLTHHKTSGVVVGRQMGNLTSLKLREGVYEPMPIQFTHIRYSAQEDPLLLQLAPQHNMIIWCTSILSLSPYTKENDFLREIYAKTQASGKCISDTRRGDYLKVITKVLLDDDVR